MARWRARVSARQRIQAPMPGSAKTSTGAWALRQMRVSKQSSDRIRTPAGARSSRVAISAALIMIFILSGPVGELQAHAVERGFLDLADARGADAERLADLLEVHFFD